ncbi:MAG: hypothetical protein AB1Z98_33315 [Nannocystaceae bacterium]
MGTHENAPPSPTDREPTSSPANETNETSTTDPGPGTGAASEPRSTTPPAASRRIDPRELPTAGPRDFDADRVIERDLDLGKLAKALRGLARLTPDRRSLGEWAATYRREPLAIVPSVDVDAWIAWVLAGVPLFSRTLPTVDEARDAATRVLVIIAFAREGGNASAVARSIRSTRKVLRDRMRRLGLYPWRADGRSDQGGDHG